ncbi:hypothetical protein GH714_008669 [Hevea brasiliensis]|uniref:Uncharacterized protein n=1 Tax=Hevea brasiliensis TaxID=3981 RepID=A0A6A6KI29_HEVBR|nr:hypothetical protein GH714_008669 [Hevea brasiliensis]
MVTDSKAKFDISFAGTFASSAFAACFAEICTIPLDTAKVRLQLQKKAVAGEGLALPQYRGALAITVANPTDLVKVRLQAEGKLPPGVPRRYTGALNAYSTIVRQEGLGALWTGLGPNIARNAIINAAELASYDQVKQTILKIPGFTDNIVTHLLSGLGAGFFAVCIGSQLMWYTVYIHISAL